MSLGATASTPCPVADLLDYSNARGEAPGPYLSDKMPCNYAKNGLLPKCNWLCQGQCQDPPLMVIVVALACPQWLVLWLSLKLQSWQVEEYGILEVHLPVSGGVCSGSPTACLRPQAVVAKLLNYWLNIINIMRHIAQIWLVVVLS